MVWLLRTSVFMVWHLFIFIPAYSFWCRTPDCEAYEMVPTDELFNFILKSKAIFGVMAIVMMKLAVKVLLSPVDWFWFHGGMIYSIPFLSYVVQNFWVWRLRGVYHRGAGEPLGLLLGFSLRLCLPGLLTKLEPRHQTNDVPRQQAFKSLLGSWYRQSIHKDECRVIYSNLLSLSLLVKATIATSSLQSPTSKFSMLKQWK